MRPRVVIASFGREADLCDCIGSFFRTFPDVGPYIVLCRDVDMQGRCESCAAGTLQPEIRARLMLVLPAVVTASTALPRGPLSESAVAQYCAWLGDGASTTVGDWLDHGACVLFMTAADAEQQAAAFRTFSRRTSEKILLQDLPAA